MKLAGVVKGQQRREWMYGYKKNNILLAHLDFSRTPMKFMKKRRLFNVLVKFVRYEHGDAICSILNSNNRIRRENGEKNEEREDEDEDLSFDFSTKEISVPIYANYSPYDNHNRCVDRVIRTIRDGVGQNYCDFRNPQQVFVVVMTYTITTHLSLKIGRTIISLS
jgi:hypothetical protein